MTTLDCRYFSKVYAVNPISSKIRETGVTCPFEDPDGGVLGRSMIFAVATIIQVSFSWHFACIHYGIFL